MARFCGRYVISSLINMRILLCVDTLSICQLFSHVLCESVLGVIAVSIRPQPIQGLRALADENNNSILIQPKWMSDDYENYGQQGVDLKPSLILVSIV